MFGDVFQGRRAAHIHPTSASHIPKSPSSSARCRILYEAEWVSEHLGGGNAGYHLFSGTYIQCGISAGLDRRLDQLDSLHVRIASCQACHTHLSFPYPTPNSGVAFLAFPHFSQLSQSPRVAPDFELQPVFVVCYSTDVAASSCKLQLGVRGLIRDDSEKDVDLSGCAEVADMQIRSDGGCAIPLMVQAPCVKCSPPYLGSDLYP